MPTISRSSPTTTSAVNEKRRPPLTTLATRLISTTRSWRSSPAPETERSRVGIGRSRVAGLEPQPALTGAFGQRPDAPVVLVAATVKHSLPHTGLDRPLGQDLAHPLGLLHRLQAAYVGLGPAGRGERAPALVVDQLREHAAVGAKHGNPRTLGSALHLGPDAAPALEAARRSGEDRHARLPTFRATYSPS